MFVTEPKCDHRAIDTLLQKVHRDGVPQAVNSDTLLFQGRADAGSRCAMLVQQVLDAVDGETLTSGIGKQNVFVTSWRFPQPGFQHRSRGSSDGCTAFLTSLFDYVHVGAGSQDEILSSKRPHLR